MRKITSAMQKHYKKAAVLATAVYAQSAMAMQMDVTQVLTDIASVEDPVNQIASATIGVAVVMYGWRKARGAIR